MVKISTSLVIAAVAAQSIAAPIFETRQHSVKTSALHDISEGARLARKLVNAHTAIKNKADRKKLLEEQKLIDQALNGPQQQQQLERRFGHIGMVLHDGPRASNLLMPKKNEGPHPATGGSSRERLATREPRGGFGGPRGLVDPCAPSASAVLGRVVLILVNSRRTLKLKPVSHYADLVDPEEASVDPGPSAAQDTVDLKLVNWRTSLTLKPASLGRSVTSEIQNVPYNAEAGGSHYNPFILSRASQCKSIPEVKNPA